MSPTPGPATLPPTGRRLLAAVLMAAALPPALPAQDSLALRLIDLDIEEATMEAESQSFWRRSIPDMRLTASVGASGALLQEEPGVPVLPTQGWRLTVSLPLGRLIDAAGLRRALHRLARLRLERDILRIRLREAAREEKRRAEEMRIGLEEARAELAVRERMHRFMELQFERGEADFTGLARAGMELADVRGRVRQLELRLNAEAP